MRLVAVLIITAIAIVGCSDSPSPPVAGAGSTSPAGQTLANGRTDLKVSESAKSKNIMAASGTMAKKNMAFPKPADIRFKDSVESNVDTPNSVGELEFLDTGGKQVSLAEFKNKKNVVLVFTEGFNKMLCPFCKTQTSRLVANYEKFKKLDTEILVVYPGETSHLDEFVEAAKTTDKEQVESVPFPIVLDPDFKAVDFFGIRSKLAHPSTYIIDKSGNVVLAYVGADMTADRPSVKAMLERLK